MSKTTKVDTEALDKAYDFAYENPQLFRVDAIAAQEIVTGDLTLLYENLSIEAKEKLKKLPKFTEKLKKELTNLLKLQTALPPFIPIHVKTKKGVKREILEKCIQAILDFKLPEKKKMNFLKRFFWEFRWKLRKKKTEEEEDFWENKRVPTPFWKLVDNKTIFVSEKTPLHFYKEEGQLENLFSSYLNLILNQKIKRWQHFLRYLKKIEIEYNERIKDYQFISWLEMHRRHDEQVSRFTYGDAIDNLVKISAQAGAKDKLSRKPVRTKRKKKKESDG